MKAKLLAAGMIGLVAVCVAGEDVRADITSRDSSYGPDTLTLDSDTGLLWLDVTLSTPYSYNEILVELLPGGEFYGFQLASRSEVTIFWEHAGIALSDDFVPENYEPIRNLMDYVGITGLGAGNLGGDEHFDFVVGHTAETDICYSSSGPYDAVYTAGLAAYDPDLTGRASFGFVPVDNEYPYHGSWLFTPVPVPSATLLCTIGLLYSGWRLRRRQT